MEACDAALTDPRGPGTEPQQLGRQVRDSCLQTWRNSPASRCFLIFLGKD